MFPRDCDATGRMVVRYNVSMAASRELDQTTPTTGPDETAL